MPDAYRVHITDEALGHLESIFNYIQRDSPQNAALVIQRLLDAIDDLEFMPARFRMAGRSRKYRNVMHARVVRPFIVYYHIDEGIRGWKCAMERGGSLVDFNELASQLVSDQVPAIIRLPAE